MDKGIVALERVKALMGWTEAEMARIVGVTQPAVNYILNKGERVPAEWCLALERASKGQVTRFELRPDLYPRERAG